MLISVHVTAPLGAPRKHIPTAQYLSLLHCSESSPTIPYSLPDVAAFTQYARSLGINKDSHIVLYDKEPELYLGLSACRAWWMFRVR